jgi:hypothetical protein
MERPTIIEIQTGAELKKWYWLKNELVEYCKSKNLNYTGSKFEILDRIANNLDQKENEEAYLKTSKRQTSKFDWHTEELTLETVITDSYKNSQNVRRFFIEHCGDKFHFSIPLMDFMKNSWGLVLKDAINEYKRLTELRKDKNFKSDIPSGNQFNKYIRDFFADNPNMTIEQGRYFWKLKRSLPLGKHIYERKDLELE